ncbi:unnamed protein product [Effrenium voratum]|nr:unnamed protein product [Effrenium voratum]
MASPETEASQFEEPLQRVSSGPFVFDHDFTRENAGSLEDAYAVQKKPLGEGSFGSAFRATCRQTGQERAVKAIEIRGVKNPARFQREINIAKKLDHPNVVRLHETFRDAKKIYLVMELCTGGELFDRIVDEAPSGFDENHAAKYIRQILSAICYLHAHRFAHRDVKPENFLFHDPSPESQLKIIDFGLACQFEPGIKMSTKAGTAYYVAPEVLKGDYDEKCDVWSAGVISFVLLCGFPPFSGDTDPEILKKVKSGSFEFRSPEWDTISQGGTAAVGFGQKWCGVCVSLEAICFAVLNIIPAEDTESLINLLKRWERASLGSGGGSWLREEKKDKKRLLAYMYAKDSDTSRQSRLQPAFRDGFEVLKTCAQQQRWQQALLLAADFPKRVSFNTALSACAKSARWACGLAQLREPKFHPNVVTFNSSISACDWPLALALLAELQTRRLQADVLSWNSAKSALKGQWQRALQAGPTCDAFGFGSCLAAAPGWRMCLELLQEALRRDVEPNAFLCSAMRLRWADALQVLSFSRMKSVQADMVMYNSGIAASASRWQLAPVWLGQCAALSLSPSAVSLAAAIGVYGDTQEWLQALHLAAEADESKPRNAALGALGAAGRWRGALVLLARGSATARPFSLVALNSAISACEKAGRWRSAICLFWQIEEHRLQPDIISFNAAISAMGQCRLWQMALVFLSLALAAVQITVITLNAVLTAYEKAQQWQRALDFFSFEAFQADVVSFNVLLGALADAAQWRRAVALLQAMPEEQVLPSTVSFACAMSACAKGAKNLITQMLTYDPFIRPTAEVVLLSPWLKFKGTPKSAPLPKDFVTRLSGFRAFSKLKKVALTALAQQLPDEKIDSLQQTFRALDRNGDGTLSVEEIREAVVQQGLKPPKALEDILHAIDCNGSGSLDYTEFLAATLDQKVYMQRDVCWAAFRIFDLDGDGKITREELAKVLNGDSVQELFGSRKIEKIIEEVDKDGDGAVDFEEFYAMMSMKAEPPSKRQRTS